MYRLLEKTCQLTVEPVSSLAEIEFGELLFVHRLHVHYMSDVCVAAAW